MISWDDDQLEEAGIDKNRLQKLLNKLEQCGREMDDMGLQLYGESSSGYLIHESRPEHDELMTKADYGAIVATIINGNWDGGGW